MHRKHSLDFKAFTNVAQHRSVFIFARHTQDLFRKFRRLAESPDRCLPASLFRILTPVLILMGILAVTAMVAWVIHERVSFFLSVTLGIDDTRSF
jgi:uncharacterized membrane protein YqjE